MSSEEMRVELESFVNTGLQKGWHGWPRKGPGCREAPFAGAAAVRGSQDGWIPLPALRAADTALASSFRTGSGEVPIYFQ